MFKVCKMGGFLADIELYDDAGYLTNISSCKKWNYATNVLNERHTYFVVLYES